MYKETRKKYKPNTPKKMKKVKEIKEELKKERAVATKYLTLSMDSFKRDDRDMYLRLHSKVQERIMTLEWVLKP